MPKKPIHLEGTTLEGGGQLLRIAIGLSSLTKLPINITNIRGRRSGGGGLKAQHLTSVQWLSKACSARLSGAGLKSKEITFTPAKKEKYAYALEEADYHINQNTPGSVNLVFQAVLPYLLFGVQDKMEIRITGGTNVSNSPSVDYVEQVLIPMLEKIGVPRIETEVRSRGWSTGSTRLGSVSYTVTPLTHELPALQLTDRGDITTVKATILAPKACESHFREELEVMFDKRHSTIFGTRDQDIEITFEDSSHDKRFYLLLVATTTTGIKLGRDWLYDHGVKAGKIDSVISSLIRKVFSELIAEIEHGGCVDEYLRDQLVVYQALAKGNSNVDGGTKKARLVQPSLHARTAQWVVGELLGVAFDEEGGCEGAGFVPGKGIPKEEDVDGGLVEETERLGLGGDAE